MIHNMLEISLEYGWSRPVDCGDTQNPGLLLHLRCIYFHDLMLISTRTRGVGTDTILPKCRDQLAILVPTRSHMCIN